MLLRTPGASDLGDYHYKVVDTKLSQETKARTILQLFLYAHTRSCCRSCRACSRST